MSSTTAAETRGAERLLTEERNVDMTPDELCDVITAFLANGPDFEHGPYVYSITVMERAPEGQPRDPGYLYHRELYAAGGPQRIEMVRSLAKVGAVLDVSMCRPGRQGEHKLIRVKAPIE